MVFTSESFDFIIKILNNLELLGKFNTFTFSISKFEFILKEEQFVMK